MVSGTTGDDPDTQVRQRHGHQQSIAIMIIKLAQFLLYTIVETEEESEEEGGEIEK